MNPRKHLRWILSLSLLLLYFKLFVTASDPINSNNQACTMPRKSFGEGWPLLRMAVAKLINQMEGIDNSSFTPRNTCCTIPRTVYELCTDRLGDKNSKMLYDQYKKAFEEYINSTVLPSLKGKKDELLLRDLLRRWSNHKTMIRWLSRFFKYLDRYYLPRWGLPSLEETGLLSFDYLVYGEINTQLVDAVLSMIDRQKAGEHIDQALINNVLAIFFEIGDGSKNYQAKGFDEMLKKSAQFSSHWASKWITSYSIKDHKPMEEKSHNKRSMSSKKIYLKSSNGDVFEVDYAVALMSQTIKDMIDTNSSGNAIPLSLASSKILAKIIEFCKKHVEASNYKDKTADNVLKDWDADFVEVDQASLFDLILAANYLNIESLVDLTTQKVADMIKGKTPEEIRKTFNINNNFTPQSVEEAHEENQWAFE